MQDSTNKEWRKRAVCVKKTASGERGSIVSPGLFHVVLNGGRRVRLKQTLK